MSVNISQGLWTISMMGETDKDSNGARSESFLHYIDSSNQEQGGVRVQHVLHVFCPHILSPVHHGVIATITPHEVL